MSANPPLPPDAPIPSNNLSSATPYAADVPSAAFEQQQAPAALYVQQAPPPPHGHQPSPIAEKLQRNVLGIVALVAAAVGFTFACIPGALIVGWILLPISFVLGLVSVFLKGKSKWQGITAIIIAIVGFIVGVVVFISLAANAFTTAFDGTDVEVGDTPATVEEETAPEEEEVEAPAPVAGTRENPIPLGTPISSDEWTVVVNSVAFGETDQILNENMFNDAPDPGTEYLLINYTVTYTGDDTDGGLASFIGLEYVTAAGVTVDPFDKMVVAPDALDGMSALYNGASATGNRAIQVPTLADGVLAIRPGMLSDKVFVAIQ